MKNLIAACSTLCLLVATGMSLAAESPRIRDCFDFGWAFTLGDPEGAEKPGFDHSGWRVLDVPHDWSVEGPFHPDNPAGAPGGYLPGGIGWYRKEFQLPPDAATRRIFIEFDAVYQNSEVWINGHHLGKRPYGYIGFEYELTPHINFSGRNVVAVRVDHSLQPSARWYTGSGIYRHVWLKQTGPVHVTHWGTRITTPKITPGSGEVAVETTIRNAHPDAMTIAVTQTVLDENATSVATVTSNLDLPPGTTKPITQNLTVERPALWSPDAPHLYTVRTELRDGERLVDRYDSPLGFREFRFDPDKGLFVNGQGTIMRGVCNHQDLGLLGTALWDQALERRLRILKNMGCNAIRTAHYPHAPELMALCDRMGFLVVNETFDEWRRGWDFEGRTIVASRENKGKARFGYHRYFDAWAERDLTDHLHRDRNHPSVIMWSIGNEVPEAQKNGETGTVRRLRDLCHQIDPTRPVTAGTNYIAGANETGFLEALDVVGYNGGGGSVFLYEQDHQRFPKRVIYASEVPHSLQTRSEYRTHTNYREKERQTPNLTETEVFPETEVWYESSYDNAAVRINARDSWRLTSTFPFVAGEFRWTGFDYIGESGGWPRVLGNFGIIDLCHVPKDTFYFYQSRWTDQPMVHILPHWNWPGKEGIEIPILCYSSCPEVELFLNGTSLGSKAFGPGNDMHLEWRVPYTPGELKAVARKDGREAAAMIVRTAGRPTRLAADADQASLDPAKRDLCYLPIRVVDASGTTVPTAAHWATVAVDGPARIVGIGNGDPLSHEEFQGRHVRTFNGHALAILAATPGKDVIKPASKRKPNEIVVTISSPGLEPSTVRLTRSGAEAAPDAAGGPSGTPADAPAERPVD